MKPIFKNFLAIVLGLILGSVVNMGIIMISSYIIPPPEGADLTSPEGLKLSMHLMLPKHFIMPFLAHALGTLTGALLTALIASGHKMRYALVIALFFLVGGIANIFMLPSPIWFTILDLSVAYLPMGYLGGKIIASKKTKFSKKQL
jgi:hypothetical protein